MQNTAADAVKKRLAHGLDAKLQHTQPLKAVEQFRRAYEIARDAGHGDRLLEIYRRIAAYRLGHLQLQMAGGLQDPQKERKLLVEALDFLRKATGGHDVALGPLPFITQLPVLRRLRDLSDNHGRREAIDAEIREALSKAIRMTQGYSRPGRALAREGRHLSLASLRENAALPVAQGPVVNLLELAVYFLGGSYKDLRGLRDSDGDPCEGLLLGSSFVLLGHRNHKGASLRLSEDQAQEVLREEAATGKYDLVFEFPAPHAGVPAVHHPGQAGNVGWNRDILYLIALVALGRTPSSATALQELLDWWKPDCVGKPRNTEASTNQALHKARQLLESIVGPERLIGRRAIEGTPSAGLVLHPEVKVLASVDANMLQARYGC